MRKIALLTMLLLLMLCEQGFAQKKTQKQPKKNVTVAVVVDPGDGGGGGGGGCTAVTWYLDADGDGYYVSTVSSCTSPGTGYTSTAGTQGDCDDNDAGKHASYSFYVDNDGDGYGSGSLVSVCAVDANTPPTGYASNNTDCDDNAAAVNPGVTEICGNGIDDNCNNQVDEGCVNCGSGSTLYVNAAASGTGDGLSWANAFTSLQDALTLAGACSNVTQIWVAKGTYKPTTGTDQRISFVMKNNLAIYGGFAGNETQLSQRNWKTNVTTLSGDLGTAGDNSDNSYHVVKNNNIDNTAILDGFTISGGNANVEGVDDNSGGGMSNQNSSPSIINCSFSGNSAVGGGGMFNYLSSSPSITNCSFSSNWAFYGGGMYNVASSPSVTNCTFSGNSADYGGGMYNLQSSPLLTNCIFWNNAATNGPEIRNDASVPVVTYSIVKGGHAGTGNLDLNPLFVSATDLRLQACSPAINAGSNAAVPSGVTTDLDGNARIAHTTVDMGAYEYSGTLYTYYKDGDGDTYGDAANTKESYCTTPPDGYVADNTDCNDGDANTHVSVTWYKDADGDGYYVSTVSSCTSPGTGYTTTAGTLGDCDDNDAGKHASYGFYVDNDGDGYGSGSLVSVCAVNANTPPTGYASNNTDCNDNNNTKWRSAIFYVDADGDGYTVGNGESVCYGASTPSGYKAFKSAVNDCNDGNPAVGAPLTWYKDADGDGYSNGVMQTACTQPVGYKTASQLTATSGDCDDTKASVRPGAPEICGNNIDDNCNGQTDENCGPCANATKLTTTGVTSTSATLKWTAAVNPLQWQVQYKSTSNGSKWIDVPGVVPSARSVTITGLKPNQTYQWHIRAKCGSVWMSYCSSVQFKTGRSGSVTYNSSAGATIEAVTEVADLQVQVLSNPTSTYFTLVVRSNDSKPIQLFVADAVGRMIESRGGIAPNTTMRVGQSLRAGTYYARVMQGGKAVTVKLVKQ